MEWGVPHIFIAGEFFGSLPRPGSQHLPIGKVTNIHKHALVISMGDQGIVHHSQYVRQRLITYQHEVNAMPRRLA
jgi:hypothetical protein